MYGICVTRYILHTNTKFIALLGVSVSESVAV